MRVDADRRDRSHAARFGRVHARLAITSLLALVAACARGDSAAVNDSTHGRTNGARRAASDSGAAARPSADAGVVTVPEQQESRLRVLPVAMTTFRPVLQTTGTVAFDADISTPVLAPISGPVTRIIAQLGDVVGRGQPLAAVSSPDFAAAVAAYRKAQATAIQTRRVADLDVQLFKNDAIARRDMEQAEVDAQSAAADRDAALAQLRALGVEESTVTALRENKTVPVVEGVIRAPIAGTVVERLINPGQLLQAGTTQAYTIADLSTMWVMANVFESDLAFVRVGDRADISSAALRTPLTGKITYIASLVDPNTKATAVRVVVANTGRLLKKDMYVEVAIHASRERQGILVPVSAVLRDEDNLPFLYVEVPGPNGRPGFARRQVTIGPRVGDQYEITGGLKPGERIIAEGGLFVQFAQSQ